MGPRWNRKEESPYTHDYQPGDLVIVTGGPFRGQEGQVTAIWYKAVEVGWPTGVSLKAERLLFRPENIRRACPRCCR